MVNQKNYTFIEMSFIRLVPKLPKLFRYAEQDMVARAFLPFFFYVLTSVEDIRRDSVCKCKKACLVDNQITVGNFALLFNCTPVGRT